MIIQPTLDDALDHQNAIEHARLRLIAASGRAGSVAARERMGELVNESLALRCGGRGWRRGSLAR